MGPFGKIDLFKSKCLAAFEDRLECLVLTGSYARGDYTPSSDLDFWLFIKGLCQDDIRKVGEIVVEIGKSPEINPTCSSFEEFKSMSYVDQFNPTAIYIEGKVLYGTLPGTIPTTQEILNYASSVAAFGLMYARHFIAIQETEMKLSEGKTMQWVLSMLMWALRYRVFCDTSKYPGSIDELLSFLSDKEEIELVQIYSRILAGNFNDPCMPIVEKAEKIYNDFIISLK